MVEVTLECEGQEVTAEWGGVSLSQLKSLCIEGEQHSSCQPCLTVPHGSCELLPGAGAGPRPAGGQLAALHRLPCKAVWPCSDRRRIDNSSWWESTRVTTQGLITIKSCCFAAFESLHGLSERFHATEVPAFLLLDQTRDLHFENFADEDVQESCHILVRHCSDQIAHDALRPFTRRSRTVGNVSLNSVQPHRAG